MNHWRIFASLAVAGLSVAAAALAQDAPKAKATPSAPEGAKTNPSASGTASKPSDAQLKKKLSSIQYYCTQEGGTEHAFANEYWNNHRPGIYVDVVSGEPLFASVDKYDSGTGWPSFTKPLEKENVKDGPGSPLAMMGKEVRSKQADSHLGHVFADGPQEAGGLRYCINSAALRFIPVEKLKEEGYGQYLPLFEKAEKKK